MHLQLGKTVYRNEKTNDLVFINGRHMWGGKINILPHPKVLMRFR